MHAGMGAFYRTLSVAAGILSAAVFLVAGFMAVTGEGTVQSGDPVLHLLMGAGAVTVVCAASVLAKGSNFIGRVSGISVAVLGAVCIAMPFMGDSLESMSMVVRILCVVSMVAFVLEAWTLNAKGVVLIQAVLAVLAAVVLVLAIGGSVPGAVMYMAFAASMALQSIWWYLSGSPDAQSPESVEPVVGMDSEGPVKPAATGDGDVVEPEDAKDVAGEVSRPVRKVVLPKTDVQMVQTGKKSEEVPRTEVMPGPVPRAEVKPEPVEKVETESPVEVKQTFNDDFMKRLVLSRDVGRIRHPEDPEKTPQETVDGAATAPQIPESDAVTTTDEGVVTTPEAIVSDVQNSMDFESTDENDVVKQVENPENNDIDEKTAPVSDAAPHVGAEEDASDVDVVDSVEESIEVSAQDVQKTIEDDSIDEKDMESPVENPENNNVEDSDDGMEVSLEEEQVAPADDGAASDPVPDAETPEEVPVAGSPEESSKVPPQEPSKDEPVDGDDVEDGSLLESEGASDDRDDGDVHDDGVVGESPVVSEQEAQEPSKDESIVENNVEKHVENPENNDIEVESVPESEETQASSVAGESPDKESETQASPSGDAGGAESSEAPEGDSEGVQDDDAAGYGIEETVAGDGSATASPESPEDAMSDQEAPQVDGSEDRGPAREETVSDGPDDETPGTVEEGAPIAEDPEGNAVESASDDVEGGIVPKGAGEGAESSVDPMEAIINPEGDIYTDHSPEALVRRAAWNKGLRCRRSYGEHCIPVAFVKGKVAVYVCETDLDPMVVESLSTEGWTILHYRDSEVTDGHDQANEIATLVKANMKPSKPKKKKKNTSK